LAASSVIVIVPDRNPAAEGVKITLMTQLCEAATDVPHVFVCVKFPLATMLATFSVTAPLFFRVTFFAADVVPTTW